MREYKIIPRIALPVLLGCLVGAFPAEGGSVLRTHDQYITGMVCIEGSLSELPRALSSLRNSGISASKGDWERDEHCHGDGYAISFPEGLEREVVRNLGMINVAARVTSAPNHETKVLIDESELSPTPISDETLREAKSQMDCKLRAVALQTSRPYFFNLVTVPFTPAFVGTCTCSDTLRPLRD